MALQTLLYFPGCKINRFVPHYGQSIVAIMTELGITLDGIAKGYIVDEGVETLRDFGFSSVLVEAGGDLVASGEKNTQIPWRVGIRSPRAATPETPDGDPGVINITDMAVATSGDYLQAFSNDLLHHHIIDPRAGEPAVTDALTATVIAPSGSAAEVWAKVALIGGVEEGMALLSQRGIPALMVDRGRALHVSPLMQAQLDQQTVIGIA